MKGLFIPDITAEMFRNGCLESIEELMARGEMYDIEYSPWIPFTERPMTDEELKHYEKMSDVKDAMILNCPLPEHGQEVLVSCWESYVFIDVFHDDDECYFEGIDIENVQAWMPLPEPYVPDINVGKNTESEG